MKKNVRLPLVLSMALCLLLGSFGCAGKGAVSQEAWRTEKNTAVFTLRDISGSTGYTWEYVISNPDVLRCTDSQVVSKDGTPGASALAVFTFEGGQAGGTTLIFTQVPPGGSVEDTDGDRLRYEISVDGAGNVSVG